MTHILTCDECDLTPATQVIGRANWCDACAALVSTCAACGSWVRVDSAVTDDTGNYHASCYGPAEDE